MSKVKFTLNRKGVGELLKGGEMQAILSEAGNQVAKNAGKGFEAKTVVRPTRAVTTIAPDSVAAHFKNLKENTLLTALGGGK